MNLNKLFKKYFMGLIEFCKFSWEFLVHIFRCKEYWSKITPFLLNLEDILKYFWNHCDCVLPFVNPIFELFVKLTWFIVWKYDYVLLNDSIQLVSMCDFVVFKFFCSSFDLVWFSYQICGWIFCPCELYFL